MQVPDSSEIRWRGAAPSTTIEAWGKAGSPCRMSRSLREPVRTRSALAKMGRVPRERERRRLGGMWQGSNCHRDRDATKPMSIIGRACRDQHPPRSARKEAQKQQDYQLVDQQQKKALLQQESPHQSPQHREASLFQPSPQHQQLSLFQPSPPHREPSLFQPSPPHREPSLFQPSPQHREASLFQPSPQHRETPMFQPSPPHRETPMFQPSPQHREASMFQPSSQHPQPSLFQPSHNPVNTNDSSSNSTSVCCTKSSKKSKGGFGCCTVRIIRSERSFKCSNKREFSLQISTRQLKRKSIGCNTSQKRFKSSRISGSKRSSPCPDRREKKRRRSRTINRGITSKKRRCSGRTLHTSHNIGNRHRFQSCPQQQQLSQVQLPPLHQSHQPSQPHSRGGMTGTDIMAQSTDSTSTSSTTPDNTNDSSSNDNSKKSNFRKTRILRTTRLSAPRGSSAPQGSLAPQVSSQSPPPVFNADQQIESQIYNTAMQYFTHVQSMDPTSPLTVEARDILRF